MGYRNLTSFSFYNLSIVVICYLLSFLIVSSVITPIQGHFIANSNLVSLMFLPHGVRVLTCVIYGARMGALYLFLASILSVFLTGTSGAYDSLAEVLQLFVGALCVPVAFVFLQFIHEDAKIGLTSISHNTIKTITSLALISSIINSVGQTLILDGFSGFEVQPRIILKFLLGDLLGALMLFICLRFALNRINFI